MIENPEISVLMSVYNAEKFVREAIESILKQTFTNFEYIIINDGSIDDSSKIITSYNDPRIRVFENPENLKVAKTCNRSISLARGKYLVRVDADDISLPERLAVQFDFMEKNPHIGLSGTWFENFGDIEGIGKYETEHDKIRFKMLYKNEVIHPSTIIRKDVVIKNGISYDPGFIGGEDHYFLVRMTEVTRVANIPRVLLKYRQHSVSTKGRLNECLRHFLYMASFNQFKKMGLEVTVEDFDLFERFCNADFQFDMDEFNRLEKLLMDMICANEKSNYLNHESFTDIIGEKWFHLCYNLIGKFGKEIYKKYKNPFCRKFSKANSYNRFKFLVKYISS